MPERRKMFRDEKEEINLDQVLNKKNPPVDSGGFFLFGKFLLQIGIQGI